MIRRDFVPDVRTSITVAAGVDQAFRVFVERPLEWVPSAHTFVPDARTMDIEPWVGGRFYETGADGGEAIRGTILEWDPPRRLVMTWRIGADWRPIADDGAASRIEVDFTAASATATRVTVTNTHLARIGPGAATIRAALTSGPNETLARYAATVARHS